MIPQRPAFDGWRAIKAGIEEKNKNPMANNFHPTEKNFVPVEKNLLPMEKKFLPIKKNLLPMEKKFLPVKLVHSPCLTYFQTFQRKEFE